jgi:hypothetical protein
MPALAAARFYFAIPARMLAPDATPGQKRAASPVPEYNKRVADRTIPPQCRTLPLPGAIPLPFQGVYPVLIDRCSWCEKGSAWFGPPHGPSVYVGRPNNAICVRVSIQESAPVKFDLTDRKLIADLAISWSDISSLWREYTMEWRQHIDVYRRMSNDLVVFREGVAGNLHMGILSPSTRMYTTFERDGTEVLTRHYTLPLQLASRKTRVLAACLDALGTLCVLYHSEARRAHTIVVLEGVDCVKCVSTEGAVIACNTGTLVARFGISDDIPAGISDACMCIDPRGDLVLHSLHSTCNGRETYHRISVFSTGGRAGAVEINQNLI